MTTRKRPNAARPRPAVQPEAPAGYDPDATRSTPPGRTDGPLWPTADRGTTLSGSGGGEPSAGTTYDPGTDTRTTLSTSGEVGGVALPHTERDSRGGAVAPPPRASSPSPPHGVYRVDFASVLDHDALVDLRGDDTDYPTFEDARGFAVEVLESVLDQLAHLAGQVERAGRFEDLDLGWWESLITKIDGPGD